MVGEDGAQTHRARMQYSFMAQATETGMAVDNLDLLPYNDVSKDGKEGEDGRERGFAVYDEERNVVDLQAVGKVADAGAAFVGMGDDYDLVAAVDELGRQLVDVAFDSSGLWEEEVADHGNVVRHRVEPAPSSCLLPI